MGFLDKLFGSKKKEEKKREKLSLNLTKVNDFSDKFYSKEFSEIQKEVFSKFAEIKHLVKELEALLQELEVLDVQQTEGNPKLRKIVITSKKTLTDKMRNLIAKIAPPNSGDFIELNSYCNNSVKLLGSEVNFGRNIAYTGIVLKEPIKKLGEKIAELNSVFLDTKKLFESKKGLALFNEVKENYSRVKQEIESKKDSLVLEKEISSKLFLIEKEFDSVQTKLKESETSIEATQFKRLMEEKTILVEKKQVMKTKLIELFFPVEKLLRVFRKMVEAKRFILSKEEQSILVSYLSNPFLALKKDNNAETLKKIFNYIKQLVLEGKISLKEKEKEKKLILLDDLIKYDFFTNIFWEFNQIEKKLNEIESNINSLSVSGKISSLKDELASLTNSKNNQLKELENQKNNTQKIENQISKLKQYLEESLSNFSDKDIEISFKP